jgi:hypothetical protein
MSVFFRLLAWFPTIASTFLNFMVGIAVGASVFVGDDNLKAFQNWLWGTPQRQEHTLWERPPLNVEVESLFAEFQQHMEARYQADILARYVLTLPALPEEGF